MTTEPMTRTDPRTSPPPTPTSGTTPGLAGTPALELDPGIAVVDRAHRVLGIDAPWSLHHGRGFTRRVGGLVQRAWSEPGLRTATHATDRAVAEIELVRDIEDTALAAELANALNAMTAMGGLVADPARATIVHRTSVVVTGAPNDLERAGRWFAVAVGLQAAEARTLAELLANATGGTLATPRHPAAAANPGQAPSVHMDRLVAIAGREPSRWEGAALPAARDRLTSGAMRRLTAADATGFSMPIPVAGDMAYLQAVTHEPHALLGNGLKVRLTLPRGFTEVADATVAAELNRLEAASGSRADGIGAWIATGGQLHHVAFLPNAAHAGDDDATALVRSDLERARWAADILA